MACYKCGRTSHYASECYARVSVDGENLHKRGAPSYNIKSKSEPRLERAAPKARSEQMSSKSYGTKDTSYKKPACYRCGRDSHLASECYAGSDVNGQELTQTPSSRRQEMPSNSPIHGPSSASSKNSSYSSNGSISGSKRKTSDKRSPTASKRFARNLEYDYEHGRYNDDDDSDDESDGDETDYSSDCYSAGDEFEAIYLAILSSGSGYGPQGSASERSKASANSSQASKTKTAKSKGAVYVLELPGGKYYVGKSRDIERRQAQHVNGVGSAWTRAHGVIRSVPTTTRAMEDLESWERAETLHLAFVHGIDNVRGHRYTEVNLTEEERHRYFEDICEKKDLCRKCGRNSHMVAQCFATSKAEWAAGI